MFWHQIAQIVGHFIEEIPVAVIIPELQLFEIQREPFPGDAMVFHEPLLGPTPEALQPVDVDPPGGEVLVVVHLQVPVAAEHETVVAFELVGIDHTAPADLLDGEFQKRLRRDIGNATDMNPAVSLQDAENRHFAGRSPAPVALATAPEVGLIELDLAAQQRGGILGMTQDGHPDRVDGPVDGPVGQPQLQGHLVGGDLQFKELDHREPLHTAQPAVVNPTAREVVKRISTARTSISIIGQLVELSLLAAGAKSMSIFPAFFRQVFASVFLARNQPVVSV